MDDMRPGETSRQFQLTYKDGKLESGIYRVQQAGRQWQFVEDRRYVHRPNEMDLHVIREVNDTLLTGTFVYNNNGLVEYFDDHFAYHYRYSYNTNGLRAHEGKYLFVVANGNITERRDFATGALLDRFTYDSSPNPLRNLYYEPMNLEVMDYFKFYNVNNVRTHTSVLGVVTYSYQYSAGGLPIKQTESISGNAIYYTYVCE